MVHFSEIESLRASLQFLAFSDAYLDSAARLCAIRAASPQESSYSRGAVVLSLTFHGIELFLKAAILEKMPSEQFGGRAGHDLEHLYGKYTDLYPEKEHAFEIPFKTEELDFASLDPRIAEEFKAFIAESKRTTPVDQLHRYPRDMKGQPWEGIFSFEPNSFLQVISQVHDDIARLKKMLFRVY